MLRQRQQVVCTEERACSTTVFPPCFSRYPRLTSGSQLRVTGDDVEGQQQHSGSPDGVDRITTTTQKHRKPDVNTGLKRCCWCPPGCAAWARCLPTSSAKESGCGENQVRGLFTVQHGRQQAADPLVWNAFLGVRAAERVNYCETESASPLVCCARTRAYGTGTTCAQPRGPPSGAA